MVEALCETKQAAGAAGCNATGGAKEDWSNPTQQRVWFLGQIAM